MHLRGKNIQHTTVLLQMYIFHNRCVTELFSDIETYLYAHYHTNCVNNVKLSINQRVWIFDGIFSPLFFLGITAYSFDRLTINAQVILSLLGSENT